MESVSLFRGWVFARILLPLRPRNRWQKKRRKKRNVAKDCVVRKREKVRIRMAISAHLKIVFVVHMNYKEIRAGIK